MASSDGAYPSRAGLENQPPIVGEDKLAPRTGIEPADFGLTSRDPHQRESVADWRTAEESNLMPPD